MLNVSLLTKTIGHTSALSLRMRASKAQSSCHGVEAHIADAVDRAHGDCFLNVLSIITPLRVHSGPPIIILLQQPRLDVSKDAKEPHLC